MACHEATGCAGEASVGQESDGVAQCRDSFDCGGDGEHLAHAGAALGAFVADDEDVAGVDLSVLYRLVAVLFVLEDAGGAGVVQALVPGDLDDAAVGREIAAQDDEAAGLLERLVPGVDDLLAGRLLSERGLFMQ